MRIGIDATALPSQLYGAGNYIVNLIQALPKADFGNEYVIFTKPSHASLFEGHGRPQIVQARLASRVLRVIWEQSALPLLARRHHLSVLHSPHYTLPLFASCKTIVTFHDMTFFLYPQLHRLYKKIFFRTAIRLSARRANAIIADSESTRQDILKILQVDPRKVTAIPLGVSPEFKPARSETAIEEIRRRFHLPDHILLYVGVLEPRKNLATLIRAYAQLVQRGVDHFLVIVGRKGWMYKDLFRAIENLGLTGRIIFTGYVPEEDLPFLYNAADLFVYPSLYEGFGLPVLEAMACGVPVITSNVSSMPEIVGNAGLLQNPHNTDEWADAMQRVLTDRTLRDTLAHKGLERSKLFSWERTARETLAVYEHVV